MKKKDEAAPAPPRSGNGALIACAVAALAVGGLVLWLDGRAGAALRELNEAIAQHGQMKVLKRKLIELQQRAPRGEEQVDPAKIQPFLASKLQAAGLPMPTMSSNPSKSGAWTEFAITLDFRQPDRSTTIPRSALVDFLAAVERERPYLKSKSLTLTFDGHDVASARVVISYFRRD